MIPATPAAETDHASARQPSPWQPSAWQPSAWQPNRASGPERHAAVDPRDRLIRAIERRALVESLRLRALREEERALQPISDPARDQERDLLSDPSGDPMSYADTVAEAVIAAPMPAATPLALLDAVMLPEFKCSEVWPLDITRGPSTSSPRDCTRTPLATLRGRYRSRDDT